jgi:hypothetical protein
MYRLPMDIEVIVIVGPSSETVTVDADRHVGILGHGVGEQAEVEILFEDVDVVLDVVVVEVCAQA